MEAREGQRQLICKSCGASFSCCPVPAGGCWCADVSVPEAALEELKGKYEECVCPRCLGNYAVEKAVPSA